MASGQALFAEFFTYVLLFEPGTAQGEREFSDGQVRQDIAVLLARQQAAAKRAGMPEVAWPLPWEAKKPVRLGRTRYGYFSQQMRLPAVTPPVRLVRFGRERAAAEARQALGSNRLGGQAGVWDGALARAGQGPSPCIGTGSRRCGWETVRGAAAQGSPAPCSSAAQRLVSGGARGGRAVGRTGRGGR